MKIYKRTDSPYWWMILKLPNGAGRKQRSTGVLVEGGTPHETKIQKQNAQAIAAREQGKLALAKSGIETKPDRLVSDQLAWYRDNVSIHKAGFQGEESFLRRFSEAFAGVTLQQFTREHVIEWRSTRVAAGVKASTINRMTTTLKHAIASAVPKYLDASPLKGLADLKQRSETRIAVLSPEDEAKLLAVLNPEDRALCLVAIDTLMRLSSLMKLQRRDIVRGVAHVVSPKTGVNYKVPLSAAAQAAIAALPVRDDGLVFPQGAVRTGKYRGYWHAVHYMLVRACKAAGIAQGRKNGGLTFHCFRHTGATRMIQAGIDVRTVMALGGWANLKHVVRYMHPCEAISRAAVEAIGRSRGVAPVAAQDAPAPVAEVEVEVAEVAAVATSTGVEASL